MKLLQLNAWGGRLESNIINLIRSESPDVVNMQEVFSAAGDVGLLIGTIESLRAELDYPHCFYSPVFQFRLMNSKAKFGNCVLSKKPFINHKTIYTHLDYVEDFSFDEHSYNIRNIQHAVISVGSKKLNILNHHGYHIAQHKNGDAETLHQMKQIGEYTDSLDGPVILSGDFNLAPHSESIELLNGRLDNLSIRHGLKTTRTPLTHKTEVCDYIFVNDQIKVADFYASDELASDHKALIVEFEL